MLLVTIYEKEGQQKFLVHQVNDAGEARDATGEFEVRALVLEDPQGHIGGYHIGRRLRPEEVLGLDDDVQDKSQGGA